MKKNIVLLSDGTGNSAASPFKTNVWRLYQALDIGKPANSATRSQIVYYDNGVGTENFKPIAALGSAFGIGVWQNVRDLYTFVCRNYVSDDQIYGFGFSRGAYTIRLLMGLIGKCGILKAKSEAQLIECVQMAYEAYRRDFLIRASKRNTMIYHRILRGPKYISEDGNPRAKIDLSMLECDQLFPEIHFVGVWDTVDAYGMPVDELKLAIDEWIWPMSFADREPSSKIKTIRHALSLDDERPTFRPVLWNERVDDPNKPGTKKNLGPKKILQVWFSGVHANVGGGYPDDGLAFVALDWMMREAGIKDEDKDKPDADGLRYIDLIRKEVTARVSPHGEQYDSRAGIAGYYRYGPRDVSALCDDPKHKVKVPTVRVHPAAQNRIATRERDYAPVSLKSGYDVDGTTMSSPDMAALENAWDIVWWRRLVYFATLALTAFMGLFLLRYMFALPDSILGVTEAGLGKVWSQITWLLGETVTGWIVWAWNLIIKNIASVLPGWATKFVPSIAEYPLSGIVALALLALLFFKVSDALQRRIDLHAEWAWKGSKALKQLAGPQANWLNTVGRAMRPITAFLYRWVWRRVVVSILGIALGILALILFSPYWITRVLRPSRPWMAQIISARTPA